MLQMLFNGFEQKHTGSIRIAGYRDKWVAMTHPNAASGASPVAHHYSFNIKWSIKRRSETT
jgi:hypothetical protein